MSDEQKSQSPPFWAYLVIGGLIGLGINQLQQVMGPNVRMVNRETHLDEYKQYVVVQELENVGRAGNATFQAKQGDYIVCQKHVFLRKGERRTFTIECPAMRDGNTVYSIKNG